MAESLALDKALSRLDLALLGLEQAIERKQKKDLSVQALQDDLKRLTQERTDLTNSLEKVKARSERLESANDEVSRRLGAAMESVRSVLDVHGG